MRSARVQLAALGFAAIVLPLLVLLAVVSVTEDETTVVRGGVEVTTTSGGGLSPWVTVTALLLLPLAAAAAWWWAGSVLGRLARSGATQLRLIEETSHELRAPLSVLTANADVLLAHPEPTLDLFRSGLERSRAAAARMQATIDALLVDARGRTRTADRRPADVMAIAGEVVADGRVVADVKGVELRLTGPSAAVCPVDAPTVHRALANLVDNAVRHAPGGSTVSVQVVQGAAEIAVTVIDRGPGVPLEQRERVFERFWSGRREGVGLGLPIARQVALAHGGDVTLTSPVAAGAGAAFRLTLRR